MAVLLEAQNIDRSFVLGGKANLALPAISLVVEEGDFLVVKGRSGSGKSTLLSLLSGLDTPSHGEVFFAGTSLSTMRDAEIAHLRNCCFGFIFQTPHLLPDKTLQENIALAFHYGALETASYIKMRCDELIDYVGLNGFSERYPNTLSGGEMQRVVFARALARRPKVIFADEPTGSLDEENSKKLLEMLADQVEKGGTVIMVTHDNEAVQYGSRVLQLDKVATSDMPGEI